MDIVKARIILKKREACTEECKRARCLTDNSKRCSTCAYFTKLDDYISAKQIVERTENGYTYHNEHIS